MAFRVSLVDTYSGVRSFVWQNFKRRKQNILQSVSNLSKCDSADGFVLALSVIKDMGAGNWLRMVLILKMVQFVGKDVFDCVHVYWILCIKCFSQQMW